MRTMIALCLARGVIGRAAEPLRVVIFYVGDPDTPFLDPTH